MTVKEVLNVLHPTTGLIIVKRYDELKGKRVPFTEEYLEKEVLCMYSDSGLISVTIK